MGLIEAAKSLEDVRQRNQADYYPVCTPFAIDGLLPDGLSLNDAAGRNLYDEAMQHKGLQERPILDLLASKGVIFRRTLRVSTFRQSDEIKEELANNPAAIGLLCRSKLTNGVTHMRGLLKVEIHSNRGIIIDSMSEQQDRNKMEVEDPDELLLPAQTYGQIHPNPNVHIIYKGTNY